VQLTRHDNLLYFRFHFSVGEGNLGDRVSATHWVKRTTLVDSRTSVTDVKFAPKYLGLVLASCSADGFVRIYEAPDVMNLSQWSLQYEIPVRFSASALAWNPTYPRHFAPMLAVGSDDTGEGPKVLVYEFNEALRRWNKIETLGDVTDPVNDLAFAPNLGRSYHMLGIASKDLQIVSLESQG
jgi:nucleoporin SEH1